MDGRIHDAASEDVVDGKEVGLLEQHGTLHPDDILVAANGRSRLGLGGRQLMKLLYCLLDEGHHGIKWQPCLTEHLVGKGETMVGKITGKNGSQMQAPSLYRRTFMNMYGRCQVPGQVTQSLNVLRLIRFNEKMDIPEIHLTLLGKRLHRIEYSTTLVAHLGKQRERKRACRMGKESMLTPHVQLTDYILQRRIRHTQQIEVSIEYDIPYPAPTCLAMRGRDRVGVQTTCQSLSRSLGSAPDFSNFATSPLKGGG